MQLRLLTFALCLAGMLCGCAGNDYTYVDDRDLKQGPGLLSGKDGVFTLYQRPAEPAPATQGGQAKK
jgi:hypothetical protein